MQTHSKVKVRGCGVISGPLVHCQWPINKTAHGSYGYYCIAGSPLAIARSGYGLLMIHLGWVCTDWSSALTDDKQLSLYRNSKITTLNHKLYIKDGVVMVAMPKWLVKCSISAVALLLWSIQMLQARDESAWETQLSNHEVALIVPIWQTGELQSCFTYSLWSTWSFAHLQ